MKKEEKKTKVMLINPQVRRYDQSIGFGTYFPIGLLSIGAMIKDICEVKIFDCLIADFEIKKMDDFTLYGTPFEKIKKEINAFNPDIVGISIPFSAQSANARQVCQTCKEVNPKIIVVFGGPDASVRYPSLLKETACDFCVVGEGEKTFFEFVNNFNSKRPFKNINGLAYKVGEKICYTPRKFLENLDELPFPAYELIDMNSYLKNKYLYQNRSGIKNSISIITSRGCPFNCVFCSIKLHMGKKYRYHSPDYVIRHIEFLIKNYGITGFHFEDDNISLQKERFEQILDKIIEKKLNIEWDTPNGVRADTLDYNLLKKIKKASCKYLEIGIESGNQYVLNNIIRKNSSLEHIIKIAKYCKKLKIPLNAYYVIGFPGESIKNMKETINLALKLFKKYDVAPFLYTATPLYGTDLYDICIKNGFIKEEFTDKDLATGMHAFGNPLISTKDFQKEDVKELTKNYLLKRHKEEVKKKIAYFIKHPIIAYKKISNKKGEYIKKIIRIFKRSKGDIN